MVRSAGHHVETAVEQGMGGAKDSVLWQAVQAERRFRITADKGFGDIRAYPPGTHSGVLLRGSRVRPLSPLELFKGNEATEADELRVPGEQRGPQRLGGGGREGISIGNGVGDLQPSGPKDRLRIGRQDGERELLQLLKSGASFLLAPDLADAVVDLTEVDD